MGQRTSLNTEEGTRKKKRTERTERGSFGGSRLGGEECFHYFCLIHIYSERSLQVRAGLGRGGTQGTSHGGDVGALDTVHTWLNSESESLLRAVCFTAIKTKQNMGLWRQFIE